ncbi:PIN domain-containing protein [Desulfobacter latus]|uniref:Type II toxin-antitoxin system VapC family toxin n=1 Tax=Desulfobacter latus TaxID=2292 RepID=A0A850T352_9BACT|nr:type II toxin-antitoxin system VapC family toxin [Desulfobacter latus]
MGSYLLDTHALIFWVNKENISNQFVSFLDEQNEMGNLYVSPISFWEIALLVKKGRIQLGDVTKWQSNVMDCSNIKLMNPGAGEMIESVNLPDLHKDPFDRLLIAQALNRNCLLVTKDETINQYDVKTFWI